VRTVLADDPRLTARGIRGARDPIRVVVDSRLRTPADARLLPAVGGSPARTIIATTAGSPAARERALAARGAEVWRLPARERKVDLAALLARLAEAGVTSLLVEGGPTVHAELLAAELADEVVLYVAPLVFGGAAPAWVGGGGVARIGDARRLAMVGAPRRVGDDLELRFRFTAGPRSRR
jgi:diaminohydroxyphosphoribosylaminopyrimidine deaminase/5-amino-6-(5-phosphoribosylamino)uracil reductase